MGIACATVLIKISLSAFEINFSFHPNTFLFIFSYRALKVFTLDFPATIGNLRYVSQSSITWAPSNPCILAFTSILVFLLKKIEVFCLFIAWPEEAS